MDVAAYASHIAILNEELVTPTSGPKGRCRERRHIQYTGSLCYSSVFFWR